MRLIAMLAAAAVVIAAASPPAAAAQTSRAHGQIETAIRLAEKTANEKGYGAFLDTMFVKDDDVMVQSEEFFPIFYGRKAVEQYYRPPSENLYAHREQYSNIESTELAPGLALVYWHNRYDMQAVGRYPVGGWSRMIAIMRETPAGWKFVTLVQSPMSLVSQARRIQEEAVSPDFVEYARRQNPKYDELIANDKRIKGRRAGLPWISGGGNTQDEMAKKASDRKSEGAAQ